MRQQYHSRVTSAGTLIWDVNRLVERTKTFPVIQVRIDEIREFDESFWFEEHGGDVTVRQVAEHALLIQQTDLDHPIILASDGRVMDGMHRVAKAWMQGLETLSAVRFEKDPEPDYIDVDLDDLRY